MKLLRWLAAGMAALVLLSAVGLFVLKKRYPPERIRELAISKLEPALGRKLRVASVSLGWRGIDLRGLEVSEAPDFSAGTFLKAERLTAGWNLRTLLERRLAISDVRLSGFDCHLVRDAAGKLNAASLGSPSDAPKAGSSAGEKPAAAGAAAPTRGAAAPTRGAAAPTRGAAAVSVSVSRVDAEGGTLTFKDASGLRVTLKDVRASATGLRPGTETPVSLGLRYSAERSGARYSGDLQFKGTVKLNSGGGAELTFKPLSGSGAGATFKLSGKAKVGSDGSADVSIEPLEATAKDLRLVLKGRLTRSADGALKLSADPLDATYAGLHVTLDGKATRAADGALKASAKGKLPALTSADLQKLGVAAPEGLSLPAGSVDVDVAMAGDKVTLSPAKLELGPTRAQARGTVRLAKGKGPLGLDLDVSAQRLPLEMAAPVAPALATYKVSGKADAEVKVTGSSASPVLAGKAKVSALSAAANGITLSGADIDANFDPKNAKVSLKGKLAGADASLTVDARDYAGSPDVRVEGSLASLDLGAWMSGKEAGPQGGAGKGAAGKAEAAKKASPPIATSGKVTIGAIKHPNFQAQSAALDWGLTGITPDLAKLRGKATLRVGGGKFEDLKALVAKSEVAKIALFPFVILQKTAGLVKLPLFPAFDRVNFSEITGDYAFNDGVMTVKESHMDSSAGYVTTTGSADLARDRLDLRIAAKVGGAVGGRIAGPLAFFVRGSMESPQVKPDVAAVLKQPEVEKAVDQGKKFLEEQGKKLLQGIFK